MRKFIKRYFSFSTGEKNAILALIFLSIAALIAPTIYFHFKPVEHADNSAHRAEAMAFLKEHNDNKPVVTTTVTADSSRSTVMTDSQTFAHKQFKRKFENFEFDPNAIGVEEWVRLGFSEKQATVIEHYKQTGAVFRKPQDLKRLFVMTDEIYNRLLPYVRIQKPVKNKYEQ